MQNFLCMMLLIAGTFQVDGLAWKSALLGNQQMRRSNGVSPVEKNGVRLVCGAANNQDELLGAAPAGYTCPSTSPPDNIQPDPNACEKYYTCYFGADICYYQCRVQDGEQLVYDLSFQGCNFVQLTDCGNRPLPGGTTARATTQAATTTTRSTTTKTPTQPPSSFVCPEPNGFFPLSPDVCVADFYDCVDGVAYPDTCPNNSLFDPDQRICVPADECSVGGAFSCPTADGFYPVPNQECTALYYTCTSGVAYETTCPGTSIFDPVTHNCIPVGTGNCA